MDVSARRRTGTGALAALLVGAVLAVGLALPAGAAAGRAERWVGVVRHPDGSLRTSVMTVPAGSRPMMAAAGEVLALEPEITVTAFGDPRRDDQWALDATTFEAAAGVTDGAGVTVAVVDTGVRTSHEDLAGAVVAGFDLVAGSGDGTASDNFHGSHVSGIVGARSGNGVGVHGAAPGVSIMPVRVLNQNGSGSSAAVAEGILRATDAGVDVINLSLGSTVPSQAIGVAVDHALDEGVVVVAASGNSAHLGSPVMYPAAQPGVIAVGAVDRSGVRPSFSGYGPHLDLVAPGASVVSLAARSDDAYTMASGTSMAAPHVAAAAALVRAVDPSLSPAEVVDVLRSSAVDVGPPGRDDRYGWGLVDPQAAVAAAALRRSPTGGGPDGGGPATPAEPSAEKPEPTRRQRQPRPVAPGQGYAVVTDGGRMAGVGADRTGGTPSAGLRAPVVDATPTPGGDGHLLVTAVGEVAVSGSAAHLGDPSGLSLNQPIVGVAATTSGRGYWLVAADGGVFTYGDAAFRGSTGGMRLNSPIVGMAPTPDGEGYWLVAADGGVFAFGSAAFFGSAGNLTLVSPVVGMAATQAGDGYWLIAADGGVFAYGSAPFRGSTGGDVGAGPVSDALVDVDGSGYRLLRADGRVVAFGDARHVGDATLVPGERAVALLPR